jgi:hypothetical protein
MTLLATIKSEETVLLAEVLGIGEEILTQVLPIIEGDAGSLLLQLLPITEQVVLGLESNPGTGVQKLNLAIPQIEQQAEAAGIQAGTAAIITSVQIVTAKLKAAVAPVAPASSSTAVSGTQVPPASTSAASSPAVPEQAAS